MRFLRANKILIPTLFICCSLAACDEKVHYSPSSMTSLFVNGTSQDLERCYAQAMTLHDYEKRFVFNDKRHWMRGPHGVVCVEDDNGTYVEAYISTNVSHATHRFVENTYFGIFKNHYFEEIPQGKVQ